MWSSGAFEHMLTYGSLRELTEEELARAVRLDPSQIAGLGPSLDTLMAMLRERKRKILRNLRDRPGAGGGRRQFHATRPSRSAAARAGQGDLSKRVREEQLHDLERLWYRLDDEHGPFARQLVRLIADGWAKNIRSTSWPPSTPSPAARR